MSDYELEALVHEATRERLGTRWLAEIRTACREVSQRFDPKVYAIAEGTWSDQEVDDLVQDVTVAQLLRQGQLDYIVDVSSSIDDVRALLRHQVRRALVRRRRRTVVDRLLERAQTLLSTDAFELVPAGGHRRYRPTGTVWDSTPPPEDGLRAAAAAVRVLPISRASGDRASSVYRTDVLRHALDLSFAATRSSLGLDDLGAIFREALTSWLPVVLEESGELEARLDEPADLPLEVMETVEALMQVISGEDRRILRSKLGGTSDGDLARDLAVSRPTLAKNKALAFERLRASWAAHVGDVPEETMNRLAQELYTRLVAESGR